MILLDRDGVVNRDRPDSVKSIAELQLLARAAAAIAELNRATIRVALVTNQAIVGRGVISHEQLRAIHDELERRLWQEAGARLDEIYYAADAPHPSGDWQMTPRRKPGPKMLLEAMQAAGYEPQQCLMIGDSPTDLLAAQRAECHFSFVYSGKVQPEDFDSHSHDQPRRFNDLSAVVEWVLQLPE